MTSRLGRGPSSARIMLVGEAFGEEEERKGEPFMGASGQELNRMLQEAGLLRSECYVTNLINARPPANDLFKWIATKKADVTPAHVPLRDKMVLPLVKEGYESLLREIDLVNPKMIITLGNYSMWALTGEWGILKWRGSMLTQDGVFPRRKLIPTLHPAAILRQWELRSIGVADLKRAARESLTQAYEIPEWKFVISPSHSQALAVLFNLQARVDRGPTWIDFDIETRNGHITRIGLSWSLTEAISIPFLTTSGDFYTLEEETSIVYHLYRLLTHPNCLGRGQNLLYDCQYIFRHWLFNPRVAQDTMLSSHSAFAALPKSLLFLASMHCRYFTNWKSMAWDARES